MTKPCPGPLPPTTPKLVLPPGACDTHVHVLGPYQRYPMNPARSYTAPEAPVEKLQAFLDAMGCDRVVIAHVTAHGTDMSVTLDAIRDLGTRARGFAILAPGVSDAELKRLHDGGIRGARLTPLFGAEVTAETWPTPRTGSRRSAGMWSTPRRASRSGSRSRRASARCRATW